MTRLGHVQGTDGKTREDLCAMIADLRKEVRRLKSIVGKRRVRQKEKTWRVGVEAPIDARPIREARLVAGWTARQLADALGLPAYRVSMWERGANRIKPEIARVVVRVFVDAGADPPAFELADLDRAPLRGLT